MDFHPCTETSLKYEGGRLIDSFAVLLLTRLDPFEVRLAVDRLVAIIPLSRALLILSPGTLFMRGFIAN